MKKTTTKDLRSPIARARDEWKASLEFTAAADPGSLGALRHMRPYLENRLEAAFMAGANAQLKVLGEPSVKSRVNRKS